MLVAAGPGSGKTRVLTERVKFLLNKTEPEKILVITFTRKAAGQMRERFRALTDDETADRVFFGTFHSFFYHCLKKWHDAGWSKQASASFLCQGDEEAFYTFLQETMAREVENHRLYLEYDYFLIDEFQDIDPLQYEIVKKMTIPEEGPEKANLFVVGDEDQSIYGFRGSDPSFLIHFKEDFPNAETVFLTGNFRCGKKITEASDHLIHHNHDRLDKTIIATGNIQRSAIKVHFSQDEKMEARWIAKKILLMHGKEISYDSMAVLMRNGHEIERITKELKEAGIPYRTKPEWNAKGSDHVNVRKELSSILRYAHFSEDLTLAKKVTEWFEVYRHFGNPEKIKEGPILKQMMEQSDAGQEIKEEAALMERVFQKIRLYKDRRGAYRMILYETDYAAGALRRLKKNGWGILALLRQIYHLFNPPREGVRLMTVHAAKGLEFETVFMGGLTEGRFPDERSEIEEERRLFYVGITRAKRYLFLSSIIDKHKAPSRFLKEMYEKG